MAEVSKNTGKTPSSSSKIRVDRKAVAIRYYYQNYALADIAAKIKAEFGGTLLLPTLQTWITEHLEMLKASRSDVVQEHRHVELEKINRLEVAYWTAWEKSMSVQVTTKEIFKAPVKKVDPENPAKKIRNRAKKNQLGELESTIRETKTLTGEARYLQGVQWCIENRMKMLGVESAKKNEFGNDETAKELLDGMEERDNSIQDQGPRKIIFKVA